MIELGIVFAIAELIGIILTLVAIFFMIKIAKITGWFSEWGIICVAFVLIVIRRAIAWYAPYTNIQQQLMYTNSTLLLMLGILYAVGFYKLYLLFEKHKR